MLPLSIFTVELGPENLLLLVSALIILSLMVSKIGFRFGAPALLIVLLVGMAVGADGLGLSFDNYHSAEHLGHFAMGIILFAAGMETSFKETRPIMKQGILLSTLGVLLTILITGAFVFLLSKHYLEGIFTTALGCFLLAAIISSTDSTSVFSILHNKRLHLRENLGPLLEFESGSNDPMALSVTVLLVALFSKTDTSIFGSLEGGLAVAIAAILMVLVQIALGAAVGFGMGFAASWLLKKITFNSPSISAIFILCLGLMSNGLADVIGGNGLLALYITAILIGNKVDMGSQKRDVYKFFDSMSWLAQLLMFLMLGLLARPSQMHHVLVPALLIGLFIMLVARPLSVFLTLLPFRKLSFKAKVFISWVGLKGAGPILFALCPVVAGLDGSAEVFNLVFIITLLSLIFQGMSLSGVARLLRLSYEEDPEVETFGMELPEEMGMLRDHIVSEEDLFNGATLRELHLPHGIRVVMVKRDGKFLVPHGSMKLMDGDHLIIVMGETDD